MDRCRRSYKKRVNLNELTDDELLEFIDSVESENEMYDSDGSVTDPDYVIDHIKPDDTLLDVDEQEIMEGIDEKNAADIKNAIEDGINIKTDDTLSLIDEQAIMEGIEEMNAADNTDAFIQAINISMNISDIEQLTHSFLIDDVAVETIETQPTTSTGIATNTLFKPAKRCRSPLPTVEDTGPKIQPTAGGFTGGGATIFHPFINHFIYIVTSFSQHWMQ